MPTYDFLCACGVLFEDVRPMSEREYAYCPQCGCRGSRQFSPNPNIVIPGAFKAVTQGFNSANRGPDSAPYSDNNSVHAPKRETFTQAFDANYKKAGGIG